MPDGGLGSVSQVGSSSLDCMPEGGVHAWLLCSTSAGRRAQQPIINLLRIAGYRAGVDQGGQPAGQPSPPKHVSGAVVWPRVCPTAAMRSLG